MAIKYYNPKKSTGRLSNYEDLDLDDNGMLRDYESQKQKNERMRAIEIARENRAYKPTVETSMNVAAGNDRTTQIRKANAQYQAQLAEGKDYLNMNQAQLTGEGIRSLYGSFKNWAAGGEKEISEADSKAHAEETLAPLDAEERKLLQDYVESQDITTSTNLSMGNMYGAPVGIGEFSPIAQSEKRQNAKKAFMEKTGVDEATFEKYIENEAWLTHYNESEARANEIKDTSGAGKAGLTALDVAMANIPSLYALGGAQKPNDPELGRDFHTPYAALSDVQKQTEEAVNEDIEDIENPIARKAAYFGYNGAVAAGKSAMGLLYGGEIAGALGLEGQAAKNVVNLVTLPTFGVSAYESTYQDAAERGLTTRQATTLAVTAGTAEVVTEVWSLDSLWDLAQNSGSKAAKNAVVNALVQSGIEGSEEVGSDIINDTADVLINGDKSVYYTKVQDYMASGMSEEDAKKQATKDYVDNAINDFVLGAVSGGVSAGAVEGVNAATDTYAGRTIARDNATTSALVLDSESADYISDKREDYNSDEEYNAAQETRQAILDASNQDAMGKRISGKQARAITKGVRDAYESLDARSRAVFQERVETARKEAEDTAIKQVQEASTPSEVETIAEKYSNNENIVAAVEEKKAQMVEAGKATQEDFTNALTPVKARELAKSGEEISSEELEKLPEEVQSAYKIGYSEKAHEVTSNISNTDVTNIMYKKKGKSKVEQIKSVSANRNEIVFETESGAKVPASEVQFSENERAKYLYTGDNGILSLENPALVQLAIDVEAESSHGISVANVTTPIKTMYTQGAAGLDFDSAMKSLGLQAKSVSEDVLRKAYEEGAKNSIATARATTNVRKGRGLVIAQSEDNETEYKAQFRDSKGNYSEEVQNKFESEVSDTEKKFLELLSKKISVDIRFTSDNSGNRGEYKPNEGAIYLNLNNGINMFEVALHEGIGEFLAASNEKAYNQIVDSVLNAYAAINSNKLASDIREYQKAYAGDKYGNTSRGASRELFNDAIGEILSTESNLKKMFDWMVTNEGTAQAQKVKKTLVDYFHDLVDMIKSIKKLGGLSRLASNRMRLAEEEANKYADMIFKAMDEAIANRDAKVSTESQEGSVQRYAKKVSNDKSDSIRNQIRRELEKLNSLESIADYNTDMDFRGMTYQAVKKWVSEQLKPFGNYIERYNFGRIEIKPDRLKEAFNYFAKEEAEAYVFPLVPKVLKRGIIIEDRENHKNRTDVDTITFAAKVTVNGQDGIMAVVVKNTTSKFYKVHRILAPDGTLFEIQGNKKSEPTLPPGGVTNNGSLALDIGSDVNNILTSESEKSSTTSSRNSISVDTNGRSLSEGQQEYFADSKIRDEQGRLKVMYHGTQQYGFTVFDRRKAKGSGYYGRGFYFSSEPSHAGQYGEQYEVYLNITNPMQSGNHNITKDQLRAFVEAVAEDEDYGIENYGYDATVDSVTDDIWSKEDDFAMLQDINAACIGDFVAAVKLFNKVNGTDYDGIVVPTETVAFESNQIKNVDNLTPTEDEDIRYSKKIGDIEKKAIEHFGTTDSFRVAGYMLQDGTLLDFSGAHWLEGEDPEYIKKWKSQNDIRQVDHEDIYEVMEASGDNRKQFMDRGNIRLNPEAPGFNLSTKAEPTAAQYRELKEFIREVKNNPYYDASRFYVDIEDTHPNKISYANNLNEDRIINDIKRFYATGELPQESSLNDFRYSIKVDWDNHNTYEVPARTYDDLVGFNGTDEEIEAAEQQDLAVKSYYANIIHSKKFAGLMFEYKDGNRTKQNYLTKSTREGYDWQYSYGYDNVPHGHNSYRDVNDIVEVYGNIWGDDMTALYQELLDATPKEGVKVHVVREGIAEEGRKSKAVFGESSPYADTLQQTEYVSQVLSTLNNQLKGTSVSPRYIKETVDYILDKYKSTVDANDLTMELSQFIAYMTASEQVDYNQMMNYLMNIGDEVIQASELKDPESQRVYNELKKELSSHKIRLTEVERKELTSRFGGEWKTVFGALNSIGIKLDSKNGQHMDAGIYEEIANKFREIGGVYLDESATPVDQIATIIDAMDAMQPSAYEWEGANQLDKALDVATTIIDRYYSMASYIKESNIVKGTEKGAAAVERAKQAEIKRLRAKQAEWKEKLNENFAALVEDKKKMVAEQQEFYRKQAEAERKFRGEQRKFNQKVNMSEKELAKTAKVLAKMEYQGIKDTEAKRKHKDNIVRTCTRLINWMNKPTDARHVPTFLKPALSDMIKAIDFMPASMRKGEDGTISAKKWQDSMRKLQSVLKDINAQSMESMDDSDKYNLALVLNAEEIVAQMEELLNKYNGTADISKMSKEDLKTLSDIMTNISTGISHMNENFMNRRFKHVADGAVAAMDEMAELKPIADTQNVVSSTVGDFLNLDMLEPVSFMEELGDAASSIMQEFFDGEKIGIQIIQEADIFFNNLGNEFGLKTKDIRQWENDARVFSLDGGKITLTTADIMSLYCTYKRESLDQQERPFEATHHIMAGGIKGYRHRIGFKEVNKAPRALHGTEATIMEIINTLTPEQMAYADRVVEYMSTTLAEHGNKTSNKLNGYSKFLGKYYFPIKTDSNTLATTETNNMSDNVSFRRLINPSFTKSQLDKADNALVVMNFFDVVTEHITGMSNYCAYAMPLSDALRWYNYSETERSNTDIEDQYFRDTRTLKDSMERVKGNGAKEYFENFLRDVNLDNKPQGSKASKLISQGLTGLAKAKAVGLNIRVIAQQPTAIIRAADVIEGKYLAQGWNKMMGDPKKAIEYAQDKSYLCYWKSKGFSDTRVSQGMKEIITGQESVRQDIVEKTGILAGLADDITWAAMYYAAENKVKAETNIQYGTEEFDAAVEEIFSDIINHTQVIDSNLRKTGTMRSQDAVEKLANAFKKEPQKTYNMLHRAKYNVIQAEYSGDTERIKEAKAKWYKTFLIFMETSFVTALAQSLVDAWRDDDEEKYWIKFLQKMFPYESYQAILEFGAAEDKSVKDVWSLMQGIWGGAGNVLDNADIFSSIPYVADIDSMLKGYSVTRLDSTSILTQLTNTINTLGSEKATGYKMLYSVSELVGYATGVGTGNALKDIRGIYNQFIAPKTGTYIEKSTDDAKAREKAKVKKSFTEAYESNDLTITKAAMQDIYNQQIEAGKDESGAWKAVRTTLKEEYLSQISQHPEDVVYINNRFDKLLENTKVADGKGGYRMPTKKERSNWIEKWNNGSE